MSNIRLDHLILPAAGFPRDNPLPDLGGRRTDGASTDMPMTVCDEEYERLSPIAGATRGTLPYTVLDDYDRNKTMRGIQSVVLENDILRAEFVPRLGGRLWSLLHKPSGRELLHRNPVFQPANLAIRNAWFSGGIEYNCGIIGHTTFTASPLFADVIYDKKRGPVLRMYEYERLRRAVYQMDFYLPDGSQFLFARMQIFNMNECEIPMYWWSNMSLDEREDVRVIAPADGHINYDDSMHMSVSTYPYIEGNDRSYTTSHNTAKEYFFHIPEQARRYEAAVGGDGTGFIQTSTSRQRGRKLFLWGMQPGGRRWQEYLAAPGHAYLEMQAGLGRSQAEYVRMPAAGHFEWLEAYGRVEGDPALIHGEWEGAKAEVERALGQMISEDAMERELVDSAVMARTPGETLLYGSCWGSLEQLRRISDGERPLPAHLHFDREAIDNEGKAWEQLLDRGTFPDTYEYSAFLTDGTWLERLRAAAPGNPACLEQLGIAEYANNHVEAAHRAWLDALDAYKAAGRDAGYLASYCLAYYEEKFGDALNAYVLLSSACVTHPSIRPLAIEAGRAALRVQHEEDFLALCEKLDPAVRNHGRVCLLRAECCVNVGRYEEAKVLLLAGAAAADIREGETLLDELWYRIHEGIVRRREGLEYSGVKEGNVSLADSAASRGSGALLGGGNADDSAAAEFRRRVAEEFPLPAQLDFRMK